MNGGYWQRALRIDLTERTTEVQPIDPADLRRFIGGAGLGAEILRRESPGRQDPYAPDSRLIFATGPFQGRRCRVGLSSASSECRPSRGHSAIRPPAPVGAPR